MKKEFVRVSLTAVALSVGLLASAAAQTAKVNAVSGQAAGLTWTAQSLLTGAQIGPFSGTGTADTQGNTTYLPSFPAYSGVVGLFMNYDPSTPNSGFICSGTLLPDRMSILTAAHCVSDGFGTAGPASTTVYFQPQTGLAATTSIYASAAPTAVAVSQYFVNPGYTGEVIDQNDIAVLRLASAAPTWAISHDIYTGSDLKGQDFNVAGYGRLGTGAGFNSTTGRLRQGDNTYDFAWGDAAFGGFFTEIIGGENFFGTAEIEFSYVSDFDNGLNANDASARIAAAVGAAGNFVDRVGTGLREVGVAGGDSGGPNFLAGLVSGVNSYGLTFASNFGDIDNTLNSSFGEFSGYVPTYIHADFINASMVPEPETYALMLLGLAAVGSIARRRRQDA